MIKEYMFKVGDIIHLRKINVKVIAIIENDPVEGRCYVIERGGEGGHQQKFSMEYLERWAAKVT